jgi:hypothetical protein
MPKYYDRLSVPRAKEHLEVRSCERTHAVFRYNDIAWLGAERRVDCTRCTLE